MIEIDAASHGGVDDARDLRERAFFAPVSSRFKIYIVDEAHMVTTAGFNALLKVVEEPPPHVKFVFATTEPDKVISTIRSRTHHYPFRLVPPRLLTEYLAKLCDAEGIAVEAAVLPLVVRAGAGSVRDSLSVLDQLLGGADEAGVSYRQAAALLGYTPDSLLDEFVDAFAAGDAGGVFACVDKVIEVGQDPRRFAEDLLRRLRDLLIVAAVPDALTSGLVDVAADQAERLSSQAASLGAGELTRAAEVIAAGLDRDARDDGSPAASGADVRAGAAAGCRRRRSRHARPARPARAADRRDRCGRARSPGGARAEAGATAQPPSGAGPLQPLRDPGPSREATPRLRPAEPAMAASQRPRECAERSRKRRTTPVGVSTPMRAEHELSPHRQPAAAGPSASAHGHRRTPALAGGARGGQGQASLHLDPAQPERPGRRSPQRHLAAGNVQRRARVTASPRGGSEDVLREAMVVVMGADFAVETMVDPSAARRDRGTAYAACTGEHPTPPHPHLPASKARAANGVRNETAEDRDAVASRDDSDLDEDAESHTELLARHLGAEIIAEEDHGA